MPTTGAARARRWAAISAIAATVLFALANALWAFEQPEPGAPAPELVRFYAELSDRIVAGALGSLASVAVFVVLACALREVLREHDRLLADVAAAGILLGLAAGIGAESINMAAALRARDGELTEELALALFDISYVFGSYASGIGFGVFSLALGAAALRAPAVLPRPLAWIAVAVGTLSVTPLAGIVLGEYTVGPAFVLVAVLGVHLLRAARLRA